ncbi:unnamed protein product [Amoebophrya sp. A25]|nr:unnamed protein product [Amoebophrya sp. A25]|eukprot:GSA25T00018531001.1
MLNTTSNTNLRVVDATKRDDPGSRKNSYPLGIKEEDPRGDYGGEREDAQLRDPHVHATVVAPVLGMLRQVQEDKSVLRAPAAQARQHQHLKNEQEDSVQQHLFDNATAEKGAMKINDTVVAGSTSRSRSSSLLGASRNWNFTAIDFAKRPIWTPTSSSGMPSSINGSDIKATTVDGKTPAASLKKSPVAQETRTSQLPIPSTLKRSMGKNTTVPVRNSSPGSSSMKHVVLAGSNGKASIKSTAGGTGASSAASGRSGGTTMISRAGVVPAAFAPPRRSLSTGRLGGVVRGANRAVQNSPATTVVHASNANTTTTSTTTLLNSTNTKPFIYRGSLKMNGCSTTGGPAAASTQAQNPPRATTPGITRAPAQAATQQTGGRFQLLRTAVNLSRSCTPMAMTGTTSRLSNIQEQEMNKTYANYRTAASVMALGAGPGSSSFRSTSNRGGPGHHHLVAHHDKLPQNLHEPRSKRPSPMSPPMHVMTPGSPPTGTHCSSTTSAAQKILQATRDVLNNSAKKDKPSSKGGQHAGLGIPEDDLLQQQVEALAQENAATSSSHGLLLGNSASPSSASAKNPSGVVSTASTLLRRRRSPLHQQEQLHTPVLQSSASSRTLIPASTGGSNRKPKTAASAGSEAPPGASATFAAHKATTTASKSIGASKKKQASTSSTAGPASKVISKSEQHQRPATNKSRRSTTSRSPTPNLDRSKYVVTRAGAIHKPPQTKTIIMGQKNKHYDSQRHHDSTSQLEGVPEQAQDEQSETTAHALDVTDHLLTTPQPQAHVQEGEGGSWKSFQEAFESKLAAARKASKETAHQEEAHEISVVTSPAEADQSFSGHDYFGARAPAATKETATTKDTTTGHHLGASCSAMEVDEVDNEGHQQKEDHVLAGTGNPVQHDDLFCVEPQIVEDAVAEAQEAEQNSYSTSSESKTAGGGCSPVSAKIVGPLADVENNAVEALLDEHLLLHVDRRTQEQQEQDNYKNPPVVDENVLVETTHHHVEDQEVGELQDEDRVKAEEEELQDDRQPVEDALPGCSIRSDSSVSSAHAFFQNTYEQTLDLPRPQVVSALDLSRAKPASAVSPAWCPANLDLAGSSQATVAPRMLCLVEVVPLDAKELSKRQIHDSQDCSSASSSEDSSSSSKEVEEGVNGASPTSLDEDQSETLYFAGAQPVPTNYSSNTTIKVSNKKKILASKHQPHHHGHHLEHHDDLDFLVRLNDKTLPKDCSFSEGRHRLVQIDLDPGHYDDGAQEDKRTPRSPEDVLELLETPDQHQNKINATHVLSTTTHIKFTEEDRRQILALRQEYRVARRAAREAIETLARIPGELARFGLFPPRFEEDHQTTKASDNFCKAETGTQATSPTETRSVLVRPVDCWMEDFRAKLHHSLKGFKNTTYSGMNNMVEEAENKNKLMNKSSSTTQDKMKDYKVVLEEEEKHDEGEQLVQTRSPQPLLGKEHQVEGVESVVQEGGSSNVSQVPSEFSSGRRP